MRSALRIVQNATVVVFSLSDDGIAQAQTTELTLPPRGCLSRPTFPSISRRRRVGFRARI